MMATHTPFQSAVRWIMPTERYIYRLSQRARTELSGAHSVHGSLRYAIAVRTALSQGKAVAATSPNAAQRAANQ